MASREGAEGYVYRIKHQDCNNDIVDAVLDILDGPQPMRDFKPTKMTPNSADQFWETHQAEYEARGKASGGLVERVHRHNAACPALRDELEKRRSLAKVTVVNARRNIHVNRKCSVSLQSRRIRDPKRLKEKSRCRTQSRNKLKSKRRDTRTTKRSRQHGSKIKLTRILSSRLSVVNKSCQCWHSIPVLDKQTGSYNSLNHQTSAPKLNSSVASNTKAFKNKSSEATDTKLQVNELARESHVKAMKKSNSNVNESKSDVISQNPNTTEPSVTSYNSFLSMDHEPMVSP